MLISILTTGGTIDKTYNEFEGSLKNSRTLIESIVGSLRLPDLTIKYVKVMNKDSLEMTEEDRESIFQAVHSVLPCSEGIIIIHGTDTLSDTGEYLHTRLINLTIPVILTGAMRPYEFKDSDAQQNVTESLFALKSAKPGVWVVMHNRMIKFPGVIKDRKNLVFRKAE